MWFKIENKYTNIYTGSARRLLQGRRWGGNAMFASGATLPVVLLVLYLFTGAGINLFGCAYRSRLLKRVGFAAWITAALVLLLLLLFRIFF